MAFQVNQLTSTLYSTDLKDEEGAPVPSLSSLKLYLFDVKSSAILNSRNGQSVLNLGGVLIDSQGHLEWQMSPEDNAIVNESVAQELHKAVFDAKWGSTKRMTWVVEILVINVPLVVP